VLLYILSQLGLSNIIPENVLDGLEGDLMCSVLAFQVLSSSSIHSFGLTA